MTAVSTQIRSRVTDSLAALFPLAFFMHSTASTWSYLLVPSPSIHGGWLDGLMLRIDSAIASLPIILALGLARKQLGVILYRIDNQLPLVKYVVAIAFLGTVTGLIEGNQVYFIVGDAYRLVSLALGLVAGVMFPLPILMRYFAIAGIINAISFAICAPIGLQSGIFFFNDLGSIYQLAPLIALPWIVVRHPRWTFPIIVLVALDTVMGLKRQAIAIFVILLPILFVSARRMRGAVLVFLACTAIPLIIYSSEISLVADVVSRVNSTYGDNHLDPSSESRIQEVYSSYNYLQRNSALGPLQEALLGLGNGATYVWDSPHLRLDGINGDMPVYHDIHFTPMTLAFRYGFIPAAVILLAYGSCLYLCLRQWRSHNDPDVRRGAFVTLLYGVTLAIASIVGYTIIGDTMLPVMVGSLIAQVPIQRWCVRPLVSARPYTAPR